MFADPQVKHLDVVARAQRKDGSPLGLLAQPFHLSRTDSAVALRPPELGEHTDDVLKEFGFSADEIKALHAARAV
jgi:formyl-CoA transferase